MSKTSTNTNMISDWQKLEAQHDKEVSLAGCTLHIDRSSGTLNSVTIVDNAGTILRFKLGSYSEFRMERPMPEKMVDAYHVHGQVNGMPVDRLMFDEHAAKEWALGFGDSSGLRIRHKMVPESSSDAMASLGSGAVIDAEADDLIPF